MKAIIIDDEQSNIENLHALLNRHCRQVSIKGVADNKEDAIKLIELTKPDLLFLDIQLGRFSGFEVLNSVAQRSFDIIFVTAYDKYGIQAIKFAALDYILKPIDVDELIAAVGKAEKNLSQHKSIEQLDLLLKHMQAVDSKNKIALPQLKEIRYVVIQDIVRCEAANTYTFFFLNTGERIVVSKPLKDYVDILEPYGFLRTHQSHLINKNFVKCWIKEDGGRLLLNNEVEVPISKLNKQTVRDALAIKSFL